MLALFCIDTARNEPRTFISMLVLFVLTVVIDRCCGSASAGDRRTA